MTITHVHNRLRNGTFPFLSLSTMEGITVSMVKGNNRFDEVYTIEVDMTYETDSNESVAFSLGMMIQQIIMVNTYKL